MDADFISPKDGGLSGGALVGPLAIGQDVEIWKDQAHQEERILYDSHGPFKKLQHWYEQFYPVFLTDS